MQPVQLLPVNQQLFAPKNALKEVARKVRYDFESHFARLRAEWSDHKKRFDALQIEIARDSALVRNQQPLALVEEIDLLHYQQQRVAILEGVLASIESRFLKPVRDSEEIVDCASFFSSIQKYLCNAKIDDVLVAANFRNQVVLDKNTYRDSDFLTFVFKRNMESEDVAGDVLTVEFITTELSKAVEEAESVQSAIWADPDCDCGFIISIGWYNDETGKVTIEHTKIWVCYENGHMFLNCSIGSYRDRPRDPVRKIARLEEKVQSVKRKIAYLKALPQELPKKQEECRQVAIKCDALYKKLALVKREEKSKNSVYLIPEVRAALKVVENRNEIRAFRVAAWLRASEILVPSCAVTVLDLNPAVRPLAIIKPLVEGLTHVQELFNKKIQHVRRDELSRLLDTGDAQKKAAAVALLGAWDLHGNNGAFTKEGDRYKIVLFDYEHTLGGERRELKGAGNLLAHTRNGAALPVRSFFLGLDSINLSALQPAVQEWILDLQKDKKEITKAACSGHHSLWGRFSEKTAHELRKYFYHFNLFHPSSADRLPCLLQQQIAKDLGITSQKWGIQPRYRLDKERCCNWLERVLTWGLTPTQREILGNELKALRIKMQDEGVILTSYEVLADRLVTYAEECRKSGARLMHVGEKAQFQLNCEKFVEAAKRWDLDLKDNKGVAAYKKQLNEKLFPLMAPSEAEALIERLDVAAEYIQHCQRSKTRLEAALLVGNRAEIDQLVAEAKVPEIERRRLDVTSSEALYKFLAPTVTGLYMALFPFLEPIVHVLTQLDFLSASVQLRARFIKNFKARFDEKCRAKPELVDVGLLVDSLYDIGNAIHDLNQKGAPCRFQYVGWGAQQASDMQNVYAKLELLVTSDKLVRFFAREGKTPKEWSEVWQKYCVEQKQAIAGAAGKVPNVAEHASLVRALNQILKWLSQELSPLLAGLFREHVSGELTPLLQDPAVIGEPLSKIRLEVLRENAAFTQHRHSYSQVPVEWVLNEALKYHLLPDGKNNAFYKAVQEQIQKMK